VPLAANVTMADLAQALGLPVLLVIGSKLGAINHALLTAECVRRRGLGGGRRQWGGCTAC